MTNGMKARPFRCEVMEKSRLSTILAASECRVHARELEWQANQRTENSANVGGPTYHLNATLLFLVTFGSKTRILDLGSRKSKPKIAIG